MASGRRGERWGAPLRAVGGWTGAIVVVGTVLAATWLFASRDQLASVGQVGYVGVAALALVGTAVIVPVFPWLLLVAPLSGIYPTSGLVVAAVAGAGLGETVPYFLGRRLRRCHAHRRWVRAVAAYPLWRRLVVVLVLAASPALSFPGLASGMMHVPFWAMVLAKVPTEALKLWLVLEGVSVVLRLVAV